MGTQKQMIRGRRRGLVGGAQRVMLLALVAASAALVSAAPVAADCNEAPGNPAAFRSISCSNGAHSCALLDNGTVKCWGENLAGQLGQGSTVNLGDGPGEMGDSLPAISLDCPTPTSTPTDIPPPQHRRILQP